MELTYGSSEDSGIWLRLLEGLEMSAGAESLLEPDFQRSQFRN